jgi:hypothetical protein
MLSGREAPGMGITRGDLASSQARHTTCGVRPRSAATRPKASKRSPSAPPELIAEFELGLAATERGRELVLHRREPPAEDLLGETDLLRVGIRDSGLPDRAGVEEIPDGADGVLVRHIRVRTVELVEADRVAAEALERRLRRLLEILGPTVHGPRAVPGSKVSALGRDEHSGGVPAP